MDAAEFIPYS